MTEKNTFANENNLPKLPVPGLVETVEQALDALRPLVVANEDNRLIERSIDMLNSPVIKTLQQHLLESSKANTNYLESEGISPTTANVYGDLRGHTLPRNPFFILEDDPLKSFAPSQEFRASILITSALRFVMSLRQELLVPDVSPKNGKLLSMSSYKNLFGTTIIPFNNGVAMKKAPSFNHSRHIVILSRSQFYQLEVLSEDGQIWFSKHELKEILHEVIQDSRKSDQIDATKRAIGAFTTELKTTWKYARFQLEKTNPANIEIIDNALFVVSLDHESPKTDVDRVQVVPHGTSRIDSNGLQIGTCTNRYYDKLNLIVTENSVAACVYPAACMDGTSVLRFVSDIYTDSVLRLARKINGLNYTLWQGVNTVPINDVIEKPKFTKIQFNLTPELKAGLHLAETRLADTIHQHEYVSRQLHDFGLNYMANKMKLPSDSLIQVCVQITYYALYGKPASSLEPVTTRKFRDARTEPICVQSMMMLKACQLFISQSSQKQKWGALRDAVNEHHAKVRRAMEGKGFERHLSALRSAFIQRESLCRLHPHVSKTSANREVSEIPPFIFEPSLDLLYKPELLVANCGNPALHLFGVTPAIPNGFGVGYIVKDDTVAIVASSQWRQTERFLDTLCGVIEEVKELWKSVDMEQSDRTGRSKELDTYTDSIPKSLLTSNNSNVKPVLSYTSSASNILGGYDYFDVGELTSRSELATAIQSKNVTRTNSQLNLITESHKDIGKRLIVHEKL